MISQRECHLVEVPREDGRMLYGAFYPSSGATAILHLHGKGGNFTSGPSRFVPIKDAAGRLAHLSLNMACHDLGYTRYDVPWQEPGEGDVAVGGGMWENISEGPIDVRAGIGWLEAKGFTRVILSGHSAGGFYAAQYGALHDSRVVGRIFMSPVISERLLTTWFDGESGLDSALEEARSLVAQGAGHRILGMAWWYYGISATSLLERAQEPRDAFLSLARQSSSPVLFVIGGRETRRPAWEGVFEALPGEDKRLEVLEGSEHNYLGAEDLVTQEALDFAAAL